MGIETIALGALALSAASAGVSAYQGNKQAKAQRFACVELDEIAHQHDELALQLDA